jgi:alpha-1,6-mannosyltransferase
MLLWVKSHKAPILFLLLGCLFYVLFAWDLERHDFTMLISLYTVLFLVSWKLLRLESVNFGFLALTGLIFRLVFLFVLPNLSPDFYRFLWDGNLLLQGINPYMQTPVELISAGKLPFPGAADIYTGISELSAQNHTNYPPLNQFFFALAALLSGKSIFWGVFFLRIFIIISEFGILYFGRSLLKKLHLPENRIFWYFLNPLIIVELTGNLHFEGLMLCFLLAAIYLLQRQKVVFSALLFAGSVAVKLIPLLFLPLLFRRLRWKKAAGYYLIIGFLIFLSFLPFLSATFAENFFATINLWFQKFEFNASIYYLIRWIGFELKGFNIIGSAGPALAGLVFVTVLYLSTLKRTLKIQGLITSMMFAMVIYLFLATTVHPWYLATPLLLSVFTRYKFVWLWSWVIFLSYSGYGQYEFSENLFLIGVEYVVVFGVMFQEIILRKEATISRLFSS